MWIMLLLIACAGTSTDDVSAVVDTAEYHYAGETSIDTVDASCADGVRRVEVRTLGWSASQVLRVLTGDGDESFDFGAVPEAYDPDGAWQISVLESASECLDEDATFHLVVTDPDGAEADCRAWGFDPDSLGTGCSSL